MSQTSKENQKVYLYGKDSLDLSFINIQKGDKVVIKPNLVKEAKENDPNEWECVISSPWLIRQVALYVADKLGDTGIIYICDAPQSDSNFEKIRQHAELDKIADEVYKRHHTCIKIVDLRSFVWENKEGIVDNHICKEGDPNGKVRFVLNEKSCFFQHKGEGMYYGADYDTKTLNSHHNKGKHEYLICATPILADVFICLPKLKTHKKTLWRKLCKALH